MKKFKVSYSYPLEHPIKVVVEKFGRSGLLGWLMQKFGTRVNEQNLVISERIIELATLHQWLGRIFPKPEGNLLEIGHVASSTALELASLGFQIEAIDLRDYPFKHCNLSSIKGDFLKYKFNKKFKGIYSLSTIEHFGFSKRYGGEDEPNSNLDEQVFEKIANLLESDGRVIISVPYAKSWVSDVWFRVYTRSDLESKLGKYFRIAESRFYRRDDNEWAAVTKPDDDPLSPCDGVALFLLRGK